MINDPVALALASRGRSADPEEDRVRKALATLALAKMMQKKSTGAGMGSDTMGGQDGDLGGALNSGGGGMDFMEGLGSLGKMGGSMLGGSGGGGGFGGGGMGTSPWDAVFTGLGSLHGRIDGNDPNTPMVPGGRRPHGSDKALIGAGGPIGGAVGSIFGFGGAGSLAGQNVGATISDIANGDINNLGLDVSQNLPPIPGMKQPGWKGLVNGATGLPFGTLFGKLFG